MSRTQQFLLYGMAVEFISLLGPLHDLQDSLLVQTWILLPIKTFATRTNVVCQAESCSYSMHETLTMFCFLKELFTFPIGHVDKLYLLLSAPWLFSLVAPPWYNMRGAQIFNIRTPQPVFLPFSKPRTPCSSTF